MSVAIDHGPVRRVRTGDRLAKDDVDRIVAELEGWSKPKITWRAVVLRVGAALKGRRFSRQALENHDEIYRAYAEAKRRLRKGLPPAKRKPVAERIAALQDANRRLRVENDVLLEMFVTWLQNAQKHGLREEQLEEALPAAHLPAGFKEAQIERKNAERAEQLEKRKHLALLKVVARAGP
jgi:hypothetical protein